MYQQIVIIVRIVSFVSYPVNANKALTSPKKLPITNIPSESGRLISRGKSEIEGLQATCHESLIIVSDNNQKVKHVPIYLKSGEIKV